MSNTKWQWTAWHVQVATISYNTPTLTTWTIRLDNVHWNGSCTPETIHIKQIDLNRLQWFGLNIYYTNSYVVCTACAISIFCGVNGVCVFSSAVNMHRFVLKCIYPCACISMCNYFCIACKHMSLYSMNMASLFKNNK